MHKTLTTVTLLATLFAGTAAIARDSHKMFSISDALQTQAAKDKLDPSIKLYFGDQKHPAVVKDIGEWKTNKKTNGFNKSDSEGCDWAFLAAMLTLQERAKSEGGNAVIGIKSNYKDITTVSETEYMCGNGAFISGVAFKGQVVKLAQ